MEWEWGYEARPGVPESSCGLCWTSDADGVLFTLYCVSKAPLALLMYLARNMDDDAARAAPDRKCKLLLFKYGSATKC